MEFWIIIIIVTIIITLFKARIKGFIGEKNVALILSSLPKEQYKVVNDVMLKTSYGTTQIDHVVVSIYGIFVIETKNYKGWITGSEFGEQWTKNMYGKKYSFRNPLKQNYAHVKALSEHLCMSEDMFIPIVVFSVESDIKVKTTTPVVYTVQLRKVIQKYKDIKIKEEDLNVLVQKIEDVNVVTKESKKEHVQQIKNKVRDDKTKIKQKICPKCGGELIERKGKYGTFLGCSNYPKCRYTNNE